MGAAFSVAVAWRSACFETKAIRDKINPVWNQNVCLSGSAKRSIEIQVCDEKRNVLEQLKIGIETLRVMFPYHIKLKFREEFMGAIPEIYFTVVR